MNLVFISNNSNVIDSGPNWSIPARIKAQEKVDSVFWINVRPGMFQKHWGEVKAHHNIDEFGGEIVFSELPSPFNHPDLVVFEGFYYFKHVSLSRQLIKQNIPYIIVPRSNLTKDAFNNGGFFKYLKKKIAHLFFFNSYIKKALAIQYLTIQEQQESSKFKKQSFISSNGIELPQIQKHSFSNGIQAVYIGRKDIYQKGLDLLLNAISEVQTELRTASFRLTLFGPQRFDHKKIDILIENLGISDIVINASKGISGKEKEQVLLNADLFVLTSRFEGLPMGLIEALSYGVPVLITKGTNMYKEVLQSDAGWCSEITLNGIKESLKQMLVERINFTTKGTNARHLAEKYNWGLIAEKFHDDIERLLNH